MAASLKSLPGTPPATHDPKKEYVAAGGVFSTRLGSILASLFADDAELVAGPDVYERMLTDSEVSKDRNLLRDSVLADEVQIFPSVSDESNPDHDLAKEIADFCTFSLSCLRNNTFGETLREALGDALAFGHKICEITYRDFEDEEGRPRLVHDTIKLKARGAAQFVVDPFKNVLGIQVWGARFASGSQLVAREKFFIPVFNRKDEDPRGRSFLRAAYNWWVAKKAGIPVYVKRIEKKAIPSIFGTTSEKDDGTVQPQDADGNPIGQPVSSSEVMAQKLADLENFSAAAFPYGADAKVLDASGNGAEFSQFFKDCNSEIATAILWQVLASGSEPKNGTRAMSKTHKDVMGVLIWMLKVAYAQRVRLDIIKPWAYYNYGDDGLRLLPVVGLGNADQRDWVEDSAAAAEWAPNVTDSQWNALTRMSGIPDPEEGETLPSRAKSQAAPAKGPDAGGQTGDA
jgi:hypothetical protein